MINYANGKIYFLMCSVTKKMYIGSTCYTLKQRLTKHLCGKNTTCSHILIKPTIHLLQNFPCETKEQLLWKEREYYQNMECINKQVPILSNEEKKVYVYNYNKIYKKENRERLYKKYVCPCGGRYTHQNKPTHDKNKTHIAYLATLKNMEETSSRISGNEDVTSLSSNEDNSLSNCIFSAPVNGVCS